MPDDRFPPPESRETLISIDTGGLKDFNNFYCYLPGGRYRSPEHGEEKLIVDLDRTAERLGIDTKALFEEMTRGHDMIWKAIRLAQKEGDKPEFEKMADEGELITQEVTKKLAPLYEAMIALGYSRNKLIG